MEEKKPVTEEATWLYEKWDDGTVHLVAYQCEYCGHVFYPVQEQCPSCFSKNLKKHYLPNQGTLYSYATVSVPPAGFEGPYNLGYGDFGEFRIFGIVRGVEIEIGDSLVMDIDIIRETQDAFHQSYVFRVKKEEKTNA